VFALARLYDGELTTAVTFVPSPSFGRAGRLRGMMTSWLSGVPPRPFRRPRIRLQSDQQLVSEASRS
jgi:hypothetical protein